LANDPSGAGGRAYALREVARASCLFSFVCQSAVAIAVHVTRSKPSAWKFHCRRTRQTVLVFFSTRH